MFDTDAAALAHTIGNFVVREAEVLDELLVRRRLLERVQLLALDVLDDRLLQHGGVVGMTDDGGDRLHAYAPGGAPAPFACDQLVALTASPHEDRLEDPDFTNRLGE